MFDEMCPKMDITLYKELINNIKFQLKQNWVTCIKLGVIRKK